MRIFKLIIISLLSLVLVFCIISFFLPSHIRISRTITINSNSQTVMKELSDPAQWKNWYPGADSAEYYHESGVIKGLVLNNEPKLTLVINEIKENYIIAFYQKAGNEKLATQLSVFPAQDTNHVMVQWSMDFHPGWYPWKKFASLMYEKVYSPIIDKGLLKIKEVAEAK